MMATVTRIRLQDFHCGWGILLVTALSAGSLSGGEAVGFAASDEPYLVAGAPVEGVSTLLEGETASSNLLPLRVRLAPGHEIVLGPGSRGRFWRDRVHLEGVSIEARAAAGEGLTVSVESLTFQAPAGGALVMYGDRPGMASAWADGAPVEVASSVGGAATLEPGQAATVAMLGDELRVEPDRASLEIARIQIRQLHHLQQLASSRPGVSRRVQPLLSRLSAASGGLLRADGAARSNRHNVQPLDEAALLAATFEVHAALSTTPWAEAGCGSPKCLSSKPVHRPADFAGWMGGGPPPSGCELCRPGGLEAVE